jgi:hypothetical protein
MPGLDPGMPLVTTKEDRRVMPGDGECLVMSEADVM